LAYSHGLRYPSTGLPAFSSSSFRRPITDAKMGLEQEVPDTSVVNPCSTMKQLFPAAEMSG
jgi:hypothetical protein